jgi:hypothetical protein
MNGSNGRAAPAVPMPGSGRAEVVAEPEQHAPGYWAGAPSALVADGVTYLTYRMRRPVGQGRGGRVVLARSADGVRFDSLAEVGRHRFGAESLERCALVRTGSGRWRLYVSCATPGSKHWRVDLLEAADFVGLAEARPRVALTGGMRVGVKDPVVRPAPGGGWRMWLCCHLLDQPGAEDRMTTSYATSPNGASWTLRGTALAGRTGHWDARGARVTSVLTGPPGPVAYYDGRASAGENFSERTGLAVPADGADLARLRATDADPVGSAGGGLRYLDVVPLPRGGHRLYYEAARPDGSHELRTEFDAR